MGAMISGGDLAQCMRVRQAGRERILALMNDTGLTALASPMTGYAATAFSGAPREAIAAWANHSPVWNGTGFPALALPMGFDPDGLPLSLQLITRPFDDVTALCLGHVYQQATDWHLRMAPHHAPV